MDRQNAIKLLDETFNKNFELEKFTKFVTELFNKFTVKQRDCTKYIANEYKKYISSFTKIGDYKDANSKEIEVLIVELNKTSSRDRARVMQRNFIANWLGKTGKDAALVVFYGDDPEDWRFSFVKMEYNLVKDESGKVKPVKELTPAKRYSFLVGVNEPNHTCRSQFLKLVMEEEVNPSLSDIEQAFSIDNVTKEFFEKYKELFLELKESLEKVLKKDKNVRREFEEKNISTVDFAKKLLGQIVFIYFLQKKGWLGVQKSPKEGFAKWGTGPKDFMRRLFGGGPKNYKPLVTYKNFFNDILEPLFYEALATERDDDYYSRFNCKIPFLNGGLFEPINDYDWAGTEILLDNSIFERIFSTFDRFNFTVKEDEPLEKEVAVDPEMLGKVFENLLEIKDRKSKGAFYTPREIVHYMCQQSLINYLETNTSIPRKDIEKFIQMGDVALDQTIKAQEQKKKYHGKTFDIDDSLIIPKSIERNYEEIDELLKKIKIVDPACGSGAFLIGMLNEIVKARSILAIFSNKEQNVYDTKREIIENCLYGVDIEPSAVEISKLRFWLSLVVDELDMRNIKPLPNLDHKIMCGNSLLEEFEGVKLFDERLLGEVKKDVPFEVKQIEKEIDKLYKEKGEVIRGKTNNKTAKEIDREIKKLERKKKKILSKPEEKGQQTTLPESMQKRIKESKKKLAELKKLQKEFFNEQRRGVKKELRERIDKLEWELIEETLKEQGNEDALKKLEQYKKTQTKPFFLWKLYFAEVFQRENPGFDVVIANPPYVFTRGSDFTKEFKDYFKRNFVTGIGKLNLFSLFIEQGVNLLSNKGFLAYIVSNTLFRATPYKPLREYIVKNFDIELIVDLNECIFEGVTASTTIIGIKKEKSEDNKIKIIDSLQNLLMRKESRNIKQSIFNNSEYVFAININEISSNLFQKIGEGSEPLGNLCKDIINGIVTPKGKDQFIADKKINEKYKPFLEGKDIDSYVIRKKKKRYILFDRKKLHRPRPDYVWEAPEKLIIRRISGGLKTLYVAYDDNNYYTFASTNNILIKEDSWANIKYILALLNSKLINWFYIEKFTNRSNLTVNVAKVYLEKIPIKQISPEQQKPFIKLVDQILSITKDKDYLDNPDKQAKVKQLEKEIDQLVYKLYGLTKEEIKIVEEFNEGG